MLDEPRLHTLQLSEMRQRRRAWQCAECFISGAIGALLVLLAFGLLL